MIYAFLAGRLLRILNMRPSRIFNFSVFCWVLWFVGVGVIEVGHSPLDKAEETCFYSCIGINAH